MQEPYVGMNCLFYFDKTSTPSAGIVTAKGNQDTLSVLVFHPGFSSGDIHDGVPHMDDRQAQRSIEDGSGVWDYTEGDRDRTARAIAESAKKRAVIG
jgi:hypothetical protein